MSDADLAELESRLRERLHRLAEYAPSSPSRARLDGGNDVRPHRVRRPYGRTSRGLLVAATVLAVVGTVSTAVVLRTDSRDRVALTTDAGTAPSNALAYLLAPGESRPLPASPIAGRIDMATVWTGEELLIWGGYTIGTGGYHDLADGAAFNPRTSRWRVLAPGPLAPRSSAAAAWTGAELIIWGGSGDRQTRDDGAAYNPATDSWRMLPPAPIGAALKSGVVWTGEEILIVGGLNGNGAGAAYRPATDSWRALSPAPTNVAPPYPHTAWSGTDAYFLLFDNRGFAGPSIAAYDVAKDRWRLVDNDPVLHTPLFWTGQELLAQFAAPEFPSAAYRPAEKTWRALSAPHDLPAGGTGVWTGASTVFYDGRANVSTYDLRTDRWQVTPITAVDTETGVAAEGMVWADGVLIVWGSTPGGPEQATLSTEGKGFLFRPPTPPEGPDAAPRPLDATTRTTADHAVTPSTVSARPPGPPLTGPILATEVGVAARALGWPLDLPAAMVSSEARTEALGVTYTEVRLALGGNAGELVVAIRAGDPAAVNAGTAGRGGLLRATDKVRVYLGTDGGDARAVEAFTADTIVYVRSEHTTNPKPLDELTHLAIALTQT